MGSRAMQKPWYRTSKDAWYAQVTGADGRRRQVRLVKGRDNEAAAYDAWAALRERLAAGEAAAAVETKTVLEIVKLFTAHAEAELAPATVTLVRRFLLDLVNHAHGGTGGARLGRLD